MITPVARGVVLAMLLVHSTVLLDAAAAIKIVPLKTTIVYSLGSGRPPAIPIRTPTRDTAYQLSLEPEFDVDKHIVALNLALRRPGDTAEANLLDPSGQAHGYQKYIFAASDFVNGIDKSKYGRKRIVRLEGLNVQLQIEVSAADVVRVPAGSGNELTYQFDKVALQAEVRNIRTGANQPTRR